MAGRTLRQQATGSADKSVMGLFGRKSSTASDVSDAPVTKSIPGVPDPARSTGDFEVVVRALIAQMAGEEATELGNDTLQAAGHQTYLGNLRAGWNAREIGDRETWLRNAIHGLYQSELNDKSALDTSMLRPGIRSLWTTELMVLMAAAQRPGTPLDSANRIVSRPMADGLARVLIWDTPTTMSPISEFQLDEWDADFDELWPIAVENLAKDPYIQAWQLANECVWISVNEDDYAAERMFIDGFAETTGVDHPVMFHPNRKSLIIADLDDPESIELAAALSMQQGNTPNPVSMTPIVGKGVDWHPLTLDPGHPAIPIVERLRVLESSKSYDSQQQLLGQIHGDGLFPASYKAYGKGDEIVTTTAWTQGAPTLLPRAQRISLVCDPSGDPEVFHVEWETAQKIVGHLMDPTGYYPERTRVMSFPNAEELAALRANQVAA